MNTPKPRTSFARIVVTPAILLVAGYLLVGVYGLAVAAIIGVAYIVWASR